MKRYDLIYLFLASLCLLCGVYLGMRMGFRHDYTLLPVHVHLNLVGWTSLALFGLSYRAFPELGRSGLATLHFCLSAPSGLLFPFSIYLAMQETRWPSLIFAPMWFFGVLVFVLNLGRVLSASATAKADAQKPARSL
jgi:hypothetical protein